MIPPHRVVACLGGESPCVSRPLLASETHVRTHVERPFLSDCNKNWNNCQILKLANIKCHENLFSGRRVVAYGKTDMAEPSGVFFGTFNCGRV